jgi:hypothetical protein
MLGRRMQVHAWPFACGGFTLVLALLAGPSAVEAHSGDGVVGTSSIDVGALVSWALPGSADPTTATAWGLVALGILAVAVLVRWARRTRSLAVALSFLVAVFACETAVHSAHHLNNPKKAEHCATYSASQHLTGLQATSAMPALPQPVPVRDRQLLADRQPFTRVLGAPTSRAPPGLPA